VKRSHKALPSFPVAPAVPVGQSCEIVFGHNAAIGKVLMQFSATCDRLILDPDAAEHVASQLMANAAQARGTQPGRKPS
jgi:hypothetical protein